MSTKPYKNKRWKAKALAERKTTAKQAITRCKELQLMIKKHETKIEKEEIRIAKHQKEIRLLQEKWNIETQCHSGIESERKSKPAEKPTGEPTDLTTKPNTSQLNGSKPN